MAKLSIITKDETDDLTPAEIAERFANPTVSGWKGMEDLTPEQVSRLCRAYLAATALPTVLDTIRTLHAQHKELKATELYRRRVFVNDAKIWAAAMTQKDVEISQLHAERAEFRQWLAQEIGAAGGISGITEGAELVIARSRIDALRTEVKALRKTGRRFYP